MTKGVSEIERERAKASPLARFYLTKIFHVTYMYIYLVTLTLM